jgi:O-antigen ligase
MGLWLLAWLSINTGPWDIDGYGLTPASSITALRAALPLVVFGVAVFALPSGRSRQRSWAEKGFWVYGVVMLLACSGARFWFNQAYWGFAFLGALGAAELVLRRPDRLAAIERLNWLSWAITVAALVVMLLLARDVLMAPGADDSAYGLINRFQATHGYGIARETGLSRMAAIPAIISLALFLSGRGWLRWASVPVFLASVYVIWIMQSRGALFSFAGALFFVILFGQKRGRGALIFFASVFLATLFLPGASPSEVQDLWMHATRSSGAEGFATASGRYDIYAELLDKWMESPLFGYGPQADRLFAENAQNAVLYALLCGGLIGATFFVAAMISAWRALIALASRAARLPERERLMFQITGAVLVFLTLRSLPENNAALFSVDLLLQYPAMLYLVSLRTASAPGFRRT